MNDFQETFKGFAVNTLMEGLVKLVTNPYFLKSLPAGDLEALRVAVAKENLEREIHQQGLAKTGEALCQSLREQFGTDGMKAVSPILQGYAETMQKGYLESMDQPNGVFGLGNEMPANLNIPVFSQYNFPLRQGVGGIWEIGLNNPRVREAANLTTREYFRENGAISSYDVSDEIEYYVESLEPNAFVHVHNRTQNKDFRIGTTLQQFNGWFKQLSAKLAED